MKNVFFSAVCSANFWGLSQRGAVLGLVLVILLVLTALVTVLLKMPGGIRRQVPRFESQVAAVYRAESAILSHLEQFPQSYFVGPPWNMDLPEVMEQEAGPWMKFAAPVGTSETLNSSPKKFVVAYGGARFRPLALSEITKLSEKFSDNLMKTVLLSPNLVRKSGSRRISGRVERLSMEVTVGDLSLDLAGESQVLNFVCDGTFTLRGRAWVDTLRVYSKGPVVLTGLVEVNHLEVYSAAEVRVERDFSFSGLLLARGGVTLGRKTRMEYPAVAMTLENIRLERLREAKLCGVGGSSPAGSQPGGIPPAGGQLGAAVTRVVSAFWGDSSDCLLPASVGGKLLAFRWGLE